MESSLAFVHGETKPLPHNIHATVVWELEVVDASHDAGEVVVGCVRWFARFADNCEHWCQCFETWRLRLVLLV
jgi:hypothetical protein